MTNYAFNSFARIDGDGNVLEADLSVQVVMDTFGITDPSVVTSSDWPGFERVYYATPPEAPLFNHVRRGAPSRTDGKLWITWSIVPYSPAEIEVEIENLKKAVNKSINDKRLEVNYKSFPYRGFDIACDQLSRSDIEGTNGLIQILKKLPDNWIGYWKATDNRLAPVKTYADWNELYLSMFNQGMVHFSHANYLKAMLADAKTYDEVKAINWYTPTPYIPHPVQPPAETVL